jgi:hypothetical protein
VSVVDAEVLLAIKDLIDCTTASKPHVVLDDPGRYFVGKVVVHGVPRESGGHHDPTAALLAAAQLCVEDARCSCGDSIYLAAPGTRNPPASAGSCVWRLHNELPAVAEWKGACGATRHDVAWR